MEHIHFLDKPAQSLTNWLSWFVFIGAAVALGGFLALVARTYGLI